MTGSEAFASPRIEWIAPARDLAPYLHTLFIVRSDAGRTEEMMPAFSPQLFIFVMGKGAIRYSGKEPGLSGDITLNAPMFHAAPMVLEGPVLNVGASFTPLGWATFCGLPADEVLDCAFEAITAVPAHHLKELDEARLKCRAGRIGAHDLCTVLEATIRQVCSDPARAVRPGHRQIIRTIEDWLASAFNPSIGDLYASIDFSQRQVQRLCRRYFGVPPAQLLKRYRAIRAAMLLANDGLFTSARDEMLAAYFDQAHLIRDIRRYTGRTPRRLADGQFAQEIFDPEGHGRAGDTLRRY